MYKQKLKPRKCKLSTCRKPFVPVTKWQEFHSIPCRSTFAYRETSKLVRQAQRMRAAQEKSTAS